ncbi:MAG: hypothetical protein Q4B26_08540 [Eubacteriales bacterium]|nr:hypothetical protein [Eubacteriales bacterium]
MKRKGTILILGMLCGLVLSGCGKTEDEMSNQVVQLTITPAPTPTPKPVESYPEATAEKNGITMVNQYLIDKEKSN